MSQGETFYRRHLPHYQPEGETYHVVFRLAGTVPSSVIERVRLDRERNERHSAGLKSKSQQPKARYLFNLKYVERIERMLDGASRGPVWLAIPDVAEIVYGAMHFWDNQEYNLIAHTIMPNHVHMVFGLLPHGSASGQLRRDGVPSDKADSAGKQNRTLSEELVLPTSDPKGEDHSDPRCYRVTNLIGSIKKYSALRANRILHRTGPFWQAESYDHVIRDGRELDRTIWYVLNNPVKARLCRDWHEWKWSYVKEGYIGD